MKLRVRYYATSLLGFAVAVAIVQGTIVAAVASHSFWAGAAIAVSATAAYFAVFFPRTRHRSGHEYAALYVALLGGLAATGAIYAAIAGYPTP